MSRRQLLTYAGVATGLAWLSGCDAASAPAPAAPPSPSPTSGPPVIYSSDLAHPHVDPDDHIDLAVAHGLDLNVQTVVLDQHTAVGAVPGFVPVRQMNHLTGRDWPAAAGFPGKLATLQDQGGGQPLQYRAASVAIVDALRASTQPVVIVVVGSCRDVAAAYNIDPQAFHDNVAQLVIFAGDASAVGFVEYNVGLDPLAFLRLMGSGLPVRWVPCFDGGVWKAGTRSSWVQTPSANLWPADLPAPVLRFFAYMIWREPSDPLAYLSQPVTAADITRLHQDLRNLWVGPLVASGGGDGTLTWQGKTAGVFEPATVRFALSGALDPAGPVEARVAMWRVVNRAAFQQAMVAGTVDAFRRIPLA